MSDGPDCENDDDDLMFWLSRHYNDDYDYEEPAEQPTADTNWAFDWVDVYSAYVRYRLCYHLLYAIASGTHADLQQLRFCSGDDQVEVLEVASTRSMQAAMSELRFAAAWCNAVVSDFAVREHREIDAVYSELRATFDALSDDDDRSGI